MFVGYIFLSSQHNQYTNKLELLMPMVLDYISMATKMVPFLNAASYNMSIYPGYTSVVANM